jgi:hypothetical protein
MKFFSVFVLGLAIFFIVGTVVLADFTSTSFELENPINFLGGGESSSSSFQYISTIGQLVQGQNSSLNCPRCWLSLFWRYKCDSAGS